jgi:small subunit ribosomal protein S1
MATSAQPTRDDFAALLDASLGENQSFEGRVVRGAVTALENEFVVIDVGLKSEGRVPLREFAGLDGKTDLKVGVHKRLRSRIALFYSLELFEKRLV